MWKAPFKMTPLKQEPTLEREVDLTCTRVAVLSVASSRTGALVLDSSSVSCDTAGAVPAAAPRRPRLAEAGGSEPLLVWRGRISAPGDPAVRGCSCLQLLTCCLALTLVTAGRFGAGFRITSTACGHAAVLTDRDVVQEWAGRAERCLEEGTDPSSGQSLSKHFRFLTPLSFRLPLKTFSPDVQLGRGHRTVFLKALTSTH